MTIGEPPRTVDNVVDNLEVLHSHKYAEGVRQSYGPSPILWSTRRWIESTVGVIDVRKTARSQAISPTLWAQSLLWYLRIRWL